MISAVGRTLDKIKQQFAMWNKSEKFRTSREINIASKYLRHLASKKSEPWNCGCVITGQTGLFFLCFLSWGRQWIFFCGLAWPNLIFLEIQAHTLLKCHPAFASHKFVQAWIHRQKKMCVRTSTTKDQLEVCFNLVFTIFYVLPISQCCIVSCLRDSQLDLCFALWNQ